jgi:uncharacterized damage-inducible protein DinB
MAQPIDDAFAHHLWATERLFEACAALSEDQLAATAPGTYGSIQQTLHHLVESDRWYVHFYPPGDRLPIMEEEPPLSLPELRAEMSRNAEAWPAVLATQTDGDADVPSRGQEAVFHSPVSIRLAQVPHHGTDHRSQVCTILSTLGVEPPDIDVWAYGEATGRTRDEALTPA